MSTSNTPALHAQDLATAKVSLVLALPEALIMYYVENTCAKLLGQRYNPTCTPRSPSAPTRSPSVRQMAFTRRSGQFFRMLSTRPARKLPAYGCAVIAFRLRQDALCHERLYAKRLLKCRSNQCYTHKCLCLTPKEL